MQDRRFGHERMFAVSGTVGNPFRLVADDSGHVGHPLAVGTTARGGWWPQLAGIVAFGMALRAVYVVVVIRDVPPGLDAAWYTLQGGSLRVGTGFVVPTTLFGSDLQPTAAFPPAYPVYQALWQTLFGDGPIAVRLAGVVLGACTILVTALVGRQVLSERAGLIAAALVAVDPMLVAVDGSSMSESLSVPLVTLAVLLALAALEHGASMVRVGLLGAVCGAAVLTRQDLALFSVVLLAGVIIIAPAPVFGRRVAAGLVGLVVLTSVVTPWAVRNQRTVDVFAVSTLSHTSAMAGANCDRTYGGESIGSWEYDCVLAAQRGGATEKEQMTNLQRAALSYLRERSERLPLVVPARVLRVWGFWDPRDQVPREVEESRHEAWQYLSWATSLILVTGGGWGLVQLARQRRWRSFPLLLPPIVVVATAAIGHGNTRFSAIAHPMLAVGVAALVARVRAVEAEPGSSTTQAEL